jgi:ABC-type glycerol-3-phosphate transport system permease component
MARLMAFNPTCPIKNYQYSHGFHKLLRFLCLGYTTVDVHYLVIILWTHSCWIVTLKWAIWSQLESRVYVFVESTSCPLALRFLANVYYTVGATTRTKYIMLLNIEDEWSQIFFFILEDTLPIALYFWNSYICAVPLTFTSLGLSEFDWELYWELLHFWSR